MSSMMPKATPLEILDFLLVAGPVPSGMFSEAQDRLEKRITKQNIRALRRCGWVHPEIWFGWILTDTGRAKAVERKRG